MMGRMPRSTRSAKTVYFLYYAAAATFLPQLTYYYRTTGLSLQAHPISFLREDLEAMEIVPAERLKAWPNGQAVSVGGIVLVRQRPSTAKGITFVTLEDETGTINLIIRPEVWRRYRPTALGATVLVAHGNLQREGRIIHVLTTRLENLSDRFASLENQSRNFH